MWSKFFLSFLCTLVFTKISFGADVDRQEKNQQVWLGKLAESVAQGLYQGIDVPEPEISQMLSMIAKGRRSSDASDESDRSTASGSSVSSRESIETAREAFEGIDETEKSPQQLSVRQKFIDMLQSKSEKSEVDDTVLYQFLEMVLMRLVG